MIIIAVSLFTFNVNAVEKPVSSNISDVTVFLSGAQITRSAKINLNAGVTTLKIENLPQNINAESIQVSGKGNFTILSVLHQINYLKSQTKTPEILKMESTLETLRDDVTQKNDLISVYKEEQSLLLANKSIGGSQTGVSIEDLKAITEYYRVRLTEIKSEIFKLNKEIIKSNIKIAKVQNQLNLSNSARSIPTSEILVNVSAKTVTNGALEVKYLVANASWTPLYDVRVTDISKPVDLTYKANVKQATGEDWSKVKLTLSTGNPYQSATKPTLNTWFLNFYSPYSTRNEGAYGRSYNMKKEKAGAPKAMVAMDEEYAMPSASSIANFTQVSEATTTIEFKISMPYDVPADNKEYAVQIQNHSLPAIYEYHCVPKIDKDAFLMARVTAWESLNMMSGNMNLYFEGTYVGKSYINVQQAKDTIDLSLGRDKNIVVTRTNLEDFSKTKTIGSNTEVTKGWEIKVRNNKSKAISLIIEDQIPISSNKDIKVEYEDISDAEYNKTTGKLKWAMNLASGESNKFKLVYSVKYPKDQTVYVE